MSKAAADRSQRQLLELVKQPGNNQCADCKSPTPRWASWDQGVFLCVQCASMHRKIGSHITKIKSLTLDTWSKDQVDNMRKLGNAKVNSLLNPDERRNPPPPPNADDSRNSELERFVRSKYEYRTFMAYPSPVSTPQPSLPPSQLTSHQPPPTRSPIPPTLPSRQSSFAQSAFASSSTTSPPPLPIRQQTLPSFSSSHSQSQSHVLPTRKLPKSVRFPETPPTRIPSPPDSSNEEEDSYGLPPPSKRRNLNIPPKGILVRKGHEIPIDWAALTKEPSWGPDEDDDVPLQALGALGMRGANVGLVGVPQMNGGGLTPMAQYGVGVGSGMGGGGLQPLMPQFTGSAKGYLHEQHAGIITGGGGNQGGGIQGGMVPQALKPQMTGSVSKNYSASHAGGGGGMDGDAFSRMFQPPSNMNGTNQGNGMGMQSGRGGQGGYGNASGMMGMQSGGNGNQSNPSQVQQFAQPPPPPQQQQRTNPFTQFAQPQPQYPPPSQNSNQLQNPPPSQNTFTSIWDDLTSLSPSPSHTPQPAPQPLRPQLTGFTPSSSFGQQLLARESSPAPPQQPSSQFLQPDRSSSPFTGPTPQPLKPQYTGYVPSPTLNLSQHQQGQGGGLTPQPLRPQVTGFVPSSSFGQSLLQQDFNQPQAPPPPLNSSSPAPFDSPQGKKEQDLFDFDLFPSKSNQNDLQPPRPQFAQPQQQQRSSSPSNPFNTMPSSFVSALPTQQQQFSQPPNRQGGGQGTNPFLMNSQPPHHLQQQTTGYYPPHQQQQPLRQQVTGFGGMGGGGGGGGGTNPFLMQQGGSGMFGNGSGFR